MQNASLHGSKSQFLVGKKGAGKRLDLFLVSECSTISRSRIQALIRQGNVLGNGSVITDPGAKVFFGQSLEIVLPPAVSAEPQPQHIPLSILYEDAYLIVLDKPAGLVVHPAAGHADGTLVNALIAHCGESLSGIGGVKRPGIVHRLDKDTSGILVVAKTDEAHSGLSKQFALHGKDGKLERAYLAFVWGVLPRPQGSVDIALTRSQKNRKKMSVVREETKGRHAVTHYRVLETFKDKEGMPFISSVRLVLETGRTHQIRVHMAHIGNPLLGDPLYGKALFTKALCLEEAARLVVENLGRQALHAEEIGFEHPITGQKLRFRSKPPPDLLELEKTLRRGKANFAKASSKS
ncbi:MAG: RluA family pseudouridine synthase [Hyphomicrobium sp.]